MIPELNERSEAILRYIIDAYMQTGEPVGSRTISKMLGLNLSPATIRNVMADLESEGLLFAPHTSAGRLPTQQGLRFYVDGLMEIGDLSEEERRQIEVRCKTAGHSLDSLFDQATTMLSGLSSAAGLVVAPKSNKPLKQIQFVQLDPGRILVVMLMEGGLVENRVMEVGPDTTPAALQAAANYLNDRLSGRTIPEARSMVQEEIKTHKAQLDIITAKLVEQGIALMPPGSPDGHIIVRGQSQLLADVRAVEDMERARQLLTALEEKETMSRLLEAAQGADGVQIFIGTENRMFEHSGWSMVISPYKSSENQIIGAIGVIGPTRLNYSRVIPLLDYTSKVMEKILGS
ncbi:MAG: heat-inducible transcriptional repressor HrcA [Rhodospirillales bacterium]|nr:heat-inducible transcriptional repressor HrcA [Rhodospirillales bacterium]MCB9995188.1 heat-inducible transcriptional repressor HrcA [Rhodospirillales bacterium]